MTAIPDADPEKPMEPVLLSGERPSPTSPPSGCRFHTRCPHVMDRCRSEDPVLQEKEAGHRVACHLHEPG